MENLTQEMENLTQVIDGKTYILDDDYQDDNAVNEYGETVLAMVAYATCADTNERVRLAVIPTQAELAKMDQGAELDCIDYSNPDIEGV